MAGQPASSFASLLAQLRAEAGLTQEELAQAAGLGLRTVSDLERGVHRTAHQDTARLLADALGLPEPVRGLFVAAARGRVPADRVLAAREEALAALGAVATVSSAAAAVPVPRELPADVVAFTGREVELAELDLLLPAAGQAAARAGPVVISAVSGTAGAGKTALAVRWAHRAAEAFPDGQLYVNLRGYDPDQPVPPEEETGNRDGQAEALNGRGETLLATGHPNQACTCHTTALTLTRQSGDRYLQARALTGLGEVSHRQGHYAEATEYHQQALAIYQQIGARGGQAEALNGAGEALLATSQPAQAQTRHTDALALARQTGDRFQQARAHRGLAEACQAAGELEQANQHWQQALDIYTGLGVPEAASMHADPASPAGTAPAGTAVIPSTAAQ